jgi:hypothetical protein
MVEVKRLLNRDGNAKRYLNRILPLLADSAPIDPPDLDAIHWASLRDQLKPQDPTSAPRPNSMQLRHFDEVAPSRPEPLPGTLLSRLSHESMAAQGYLQ